MLKAGIAVEVKDLGEKTLEMIGSSESMDRDREVIKADGWELENFLKNPVILFAHDPTQPPIAKAVGIAVEDGKLKFRIKFPEDGVYDFADTIYKLYKGGFMNASSVGFMPKEWKDGSGRDGEPFRTYLKQELLELSLVPVPSNPEALVTAKAMGEKAIEGKAISKSEFDSLIDKMSILLNKNAPKIKENESGDEKRDRVGSLEGEEIKSLKTQLCAFNGILEGMKKEIENLKLSIEEVKRERTKYDLLMLRSSGLKPTLDDDYEGEVIEALKQLKEEL